MKSMILAALATTLLAGGSTAQERPPQKIIAIFLMESRGSPLKGDEISSLTDYMAAKLGEKGEFQIIPRDEIKKHLVAAKKDSYKDCYDSSCQIQIGKELAAEFSISSAVSKVGSQCLIYASVWDLAKSTQIKSATERSQCDPEVLINAIEKIAEKLELAMTGKEPPPNSTPGQPAPVEQPKSVEQPKPVEPPPVAVAPVRQAGALQGRYLALPAAEFNEGETIRLAWTGTPGNDSDWVSVAVAGSQPSDYWTYCNTNGQRDGTFDIQGLPVGSYEARLFLNWRGGGGYNVVDQVTFSVVNATLKSLVARAQFLGLAKTVFAPGEKIPVHYFGTTGYRADWITIVPQGSPDTEVGNYDYLRDVQGVWDAPALPPGAYEARIFLNYKKVGYVVADRIAFQVR
jgi:hypothetical protein